MALKIPAHIAEAKGIEPPGILKIPTHIAEAKGITEEQEGREDFISGFAEAEIIPPDPLTADLDLEKKAAALVPEPEVAPPDASRVAILPPGQ